MNANFHALILAGGIGARLWPKSRRSRPKQFLRLSKTKSLLQGTMERVEALLPKKNIWVVCKPYQRDEVIQQIPDVRESNIIVEPCPKGTAAAVLLGTMTIERHDPDAVISVFPSDHFVSPMEKFIDTLRVGMEWAKQTCSVVIYGIRPSGPETSYGYIETGGTAGGCGGLSCMEVTNFHEKPDPRTAKAYFQSNRFLWNSGMLSFSVAVMKMLLEKEPFRIWAPLSKIIPQGRHDPERTLELYARLPDDAFDTAVLERLARCDGRSGAPDVPALVVFPCDFQWLDLGVWESHYKMLEKDENGNAVSGRALVLDCKGSLVISEGRRLIGAIGLRDMVVVCVEDAVLVCPRKELYRVRELVEALKKSDYEDYV